MDSAGKSAQQDAAQTMRDGPVLIDANREAAFAQDGFIVVPLFSPSEIEEMEREFSRFAEGAASANHGPIYVSFFEGDEPRRTRLEEAVESRLVPALEPWVRGGRIQNHGVVAKGPGAETLPIHHHPAVSDCVFQREMICWCPLADVGETTGAMRFIPRSHHILPYIRLPRGADYYAAFAAEVERHAVTVPLKAGEALLFDNTILHGSCPNRQDRTRLAISCQILPKAARNGICLEGAPGWIDFIEAPSAVALDRFIKTGVRSDDWPCVKRIPNRNRPISEAEFLALLHSPLKASESVDPLDALRPVQSGNGAGLPARARKLLGRLSGRR
jgi:hypothetical protein